ncbi:MAG: zinc dependent phospholipase C family protein [Bacteroidota bacterium]
MVKKILLVLLICNISNYSFGWGFWAHKRINRLSVFTLPPEMLKFYKAHIEFITEHAVDPDKRRYAIDGEDIKHFIDIDHYGTLPFDNVPRYWDDAIATFSEDTLRSYGIIPYSLPREVFKLTQAFRNGDLEKILKYSADIGHYVGDSHVPLHTTLNYNGQLTGQKGIHGFWESRLPELFGEKYNFLVGRAYFIPNIEMEVWDAVLESHTALDSVLSFERALSETFSPDKKYSYESRNAVTVRAYSKEYSAKYHQMLGGQVERRMRKSILRIGSIWYTAWKNAGSPDLSDLAKKTYKDKPVIFKKKLKNIQNREGLYVSGSLKSFRNGNWATNLHEESCCCRFPEDHRVSTPSLYQIASTLAWRPDAYAVPEEQTALPLVDKIWNWLSLLV